MRSEALDKSGSNPWVVFPGWLRLWLLVLSGTIAATGQLSEPLQSRVAPSLTVETNAAEPPWARIVMVGASATAGFTLSEPLGGTNTVRYRLSRYVDAALVPPHESVRNLASSMFFLQPEVLGRAQIDQALQAKPTLIIGLDFLFWFCYGNVRTNEDRLPRFETGLKLLENVPCLLVVGDLPDASAATNGILSEKEIPSAAVLSAANGRLAEWAATRPQVVVLALSKFMRTAMANQAFTLHGYTLPAGQTRILLQGDQLHPSPPGCAVLALAILDAIQSKQSALSTADVRWNPKEVYRLVFNSSH